VCVSYFFGSGFGLELFKALGLLYLGDTLFITWIHPTAGRQ